MARFGVYRADGTVLSEPDEDAANGQSVTVEGTVRERVPGTPLFFRVSGAAYARFTDEQREAVRAEAKAAHDAWDALDADTVTTVAPELARGLGVKVRALKGSGTDGGLLKADWTALMAAHGEPAPKVERVSVPAAPSRSTGRVSADKTEGEVSNG